MFTGGSYFVVSILLSGWTIVDEFSLICLLSYQCLPFVVFPQVQLCAYRKTCGLCKLFIMQNSCVSKFAYFPSDGNDHVEDFISERS